MRVVRSFEPPCCALHHNYSLKPVVSGGSQLESRRREMYAERKAGGAPCTIVTQRSCMRTYDIIVNISGLVNKVRWYPRGWPESRLNPASGTATALARETLPRGAARLLPRLWKLMTETRSWKRSIGNHRRADIP